MYIRVLPDVTQIRSNTWIERIYLRPTSSLLIVALFHMQHSWDKRIMAKWLIAMFQTLWPRRVTILWHLCQSNLSKPRLIQWVWIHFCHSSNSLLLSTDVLKYEPCVYPPALFEATGTMLQSDKQMPYRDEYHLQVLKSPGCQLHLWWRCSDPQNSI